MSTITIDPPFSSDATPVAVAPPASAARAAWLGFLVVIAASVMDLLDSTIAQTAAPAIRRELGGSYADLEWISAAYTLAMAATLLVGSRLGDLFGRSRVLLIGMGMGMVFVPMFDVILAGVAPRELGSASGLLESVQQLAMSLGIAAVGTVLFDEVGSGHGRTVFVAGADHALLVAIALLGAAGAAACWLPKHAR